MAKTCTPAASSAPLLEPRSVPVPGMPSTAMELAAYFAERAAQLKEAKLLATRYQAIVRHLPLPTFITEPHGPCSYVNPAYETMLGAPSEKLTGFQWLDYVHSEDRQGVIDLWKECVDTRRPYIHKQRFLRPNGDITRVLVIAVELPCSSWVGYIMPATWANFEDPLPDITSELDRFFFLSVDPLIVADRDGFIVRANPAWHKVLGWKEQDLVGHHYLEFVHPEDHEVTKAVAETLVQNPVLRFSNRWRGADGDYKTLSWVSSPYIHDQNYAVARDVTR